MSLANNHSFSPAALLSSLPFLVEGRIPLAASTSAFSQGPVLSQAGFCQCFIQPVPFWIGTHSNRCGPSLRSAGTWPVTTFMFCVRPSSNQCMDYHSSWGGQATALVPLQRHVVNFRCRYRWLWMLFPLKELYPLASCPRSSVESLW